MRKSAAVLAGLLLSAALPAQAADREWSLELTPYVWFAGIDADVTVANRTVDVDLSFGDLWDAVDVGGMLLGIVQYHRLVGMAQLDYIQMDTNNLENAPARGRLESKFFGASMGAGVQLGGLTKAATMDVLLGARVIHLDNDITLYGVGSAQRTSTIADPVLFLRPSLRLTSWLRFNPTMSIGGLGDSDLTYELQPMLQLQILDNLAARVGYRRVYYDVEKDAVKFKGSFSGFLVGLGLTI